MITCVIHEKGSCCYLVWPLPFNFSRSVCTLPVTGFLSGEAALLVKKFFLAWAPTCNL